MKKLSTVLFVMAILVVGLGFYRGWFAVSRPAAETGSNKVNIALEADPDKMKQDAKLVTDRATELTGGAGKDAKANDQANDNVKSNEL
jgi:hypothetical protein